MDHYFIINKLDSNKQVFEALLSNKSKTEYLWKPEENRWCLLEIICHLYDEEREDFRTRVRVTLESPNTPPPQIDPVGWVTSRKYMAQDYNEMVGKFINERAESINWLKSLNEPKWTNSFNHPELGSLSSEHFLTNWLAHDILHFRQIINLQFQSLKANSKIDLTYAGNW
jgi:hypothetical protein